MKTMTKNFIRRVEIKIDPVDIIKWLECQSGDIKIYWHDRKGDFTVGAAGCVDYIRYDSPLDYRAVMEKMEIRLRSASPMVRYYGGISFNPAYTSDEWESFGAARFVIPRFEVTRSPLGAFLAGNFTEDDYPDDPEKLLESVIKRPYDSRKDDTRLTPEGRKDTPSLEEWEKTVNNSIGEIKAGEYEKIVLARKAAFNFKNNVDGFSVLEKLKGLTGDSFVFAFRFDGKTMFLGASPERLFNRNGKTVKTEAIAGTRPRGLGAGDDEAIKKDLKTSKKDINEHAIVKNMIDEKLTPICDNLSMDKEPSILTLRYGHHLFTSFKGSLKDNVSDGELLEALHPTPAVSGYPVELAKDKIRSKELFTRGWYSGVVGYKGMDMSEFAVAIRSGLVSGNSLNIYAGAGIVTGSIPLSEWLEIDQKLTSFIEILENEV